MSRNDKGRRRRKRRYGKHLHARPKPKRKQGPKKSKVTAAVKLGIADPQHVTAGWCDGFTQALVSMVEPIIEVAEQVTTTTVAAKDVVGERIASAIATVGSGFSSAAVSKGFAFTITAALTVAPVGAHDADAVAEGVYNTSTLGGMGPPTPPGNIPEDATAIWCNTAFWVVALGVPFVLTRKGGWADLSSRVSAPSSMLLCKVLTFINALMKSIAGPQAAADAFRDVGWALVGSAARELPHDPPFPLGTSAEMKLGVSIPPFLLGAFWCGWRYNHHSKHASEPAWAAAAAIVGLFAWAAPVWWGMPTVGWQAIYGTATVMGALEGVGKTLTREVPNIKTHLGKGDFSRYFCHELLPKLITSTPVGMAWMWSAVLQNLSVVRSLAYALLGALNLTATVAVFDGLAENMGKFYETEAWKKSSACERSWTEGWRELCHEAGGDPDEWFPLGPAKPLLSDDGRHSGTDHGHGEAGKLQSTDPVAEARAAEPVDSGAGASKDDEVSSDGDPVAADEVAVEVASETGSHMSSVATDEADENPGSQEGDGASSHAGSEPVAAEPQEQAPRRGSLPLLHAHSLSNGERNPLIRQRSGSFDL